MSIAPIMKVWEQAHSASDSSSHHDAMRMFYAVEKNLKTEQEASLGNAKMQGICSKLIRQVETEIRAYTELMEGNYWCALNVTRASTGGEIKKSYRKLALKHHPDRSKGDGCPGADRLFPLIQNAYECLSEESSKRKYRESVNVSDAMHKLRAAGKASSSGSSSHNENKNPNRAGGKPSSSSYPPDYDRFSKKKQQQQQQQHEGGRKESYYAKYQRQQEERREGKQRHQGAWTKEGREKPQPQPQPQSQPYKSAYQKETDDYYYAKQRKWEREKAEQEKAAWKVRMEEIRKKRAEVERARKERDRRAAEEAKKRREERKARDKEWEQQQAEQARKDALKKIVKLKELRLMSGKEIKERLVMLKHDVKMLFEKEDYIKKYCVVTGQNYEPFEIVKEEVDVKDSKSGDGSWFEFEARVNKMGVKQLREFIKGRKGNLSGLLEKSDLVEKALSMFEGSKSMGRTMFGNHGGDADDEKEEKNKKKGQPNISTEKMREYERKMKGRGGGGGARSSPEKKMEDELEEGEVTLEDVAKEYKSRMGRTAFGRAFRDEEEEEEEEEEEGGREREQRDGGKHRGERGWWRGRRVTRFLGLGDRFG